jgi:hypothetical protein
MIQTIAAAAMIAAFAHVSPAQDTATVAGTLPDRALVTRWASLTAYLLDEFKQDNRTPVANIEGDFSSREVRVRVTSAREDVWVSKTLTEAELRTADMRAVAKTLYAAAKRKVASR